MANVKISELVASDVLIGDEILPIVQGGITKKVTVNQIVDNVDIYTKSESDVIFDTKVDKVTGSSLVEDTKVTAYDSHIADTLNPHGVTASQVGAYTTGQTDTLLTAKENTANKGVANGYASLDLNGKVPLTQISDSILGQLEYMGVWDFTTLPTATQKGQYWVSSVAGNGYEVGDWAVYNGTTFDKVDNTDAVSSVAGRTGNVVLTKNDVGLSNVTNDVQEPTANKKTDIETNKTSNTFFPTIKAVYDWAKGLFAPKDNPVFTGNVGIGTNSPISPLHINNNNTVNTSARQTYSTPNVRGDIQTAEGAYRYFLAPTSGMEIVTSTNHPISMGVNQTGGGTPSLVIDTDTNVKHNTFTKLGSDAPAIKYKKLTGTTASTEGETTAIAHGLTGSKIISWTCLVHHTSGGSIPPAFLRVGGEAGYQYEAYQDSDGTFRVINHPTNSGNILSKPFTILVVVEE